MLYAYLVKIGLQQRKVDNEKVIMKRLVTSRYKYLIKVQKYREDGYLIVYLDQTWFLSHDTVQMLWSGSTKSCSLSELSPRGKRVVKCHAGQSKKLFRSFPFVLWKITFNFACRLLWWYEWCCNWGLPWEHVNCKFTRRKQSSGSDGKHKMPQ